jgi:hypothetical protein
VSYYKDEAIDIANAERSRRGKRANNRGKDFERTVADRLNGKRIGQFGSKVDVSVAATEMMQGLAIQCKVGQSFPLRLQALLESIPTRGDEIAVVVCGDSPGAGVRRKAMAIMSLDDLATLIELRR